MRARPALTLPAKAAALRYRPTRRPPRPHPASRKVGRIGFAAGSMDVIIDDGDHFPPVMEKTLHVMWPYLRVGGQAKGNRTD